MKLGGVLKALINDLVNPGVLEFSLRYRPRIFQCVGKIFCGISNGTSEILHKISYPYILQLQYTICQISKIVWALETPPGLSSIWFESNWSESIRSRFSPKLFWYV